MMQAEEAMPDYRNLEHPIIVLIRGLPGSGKSYLADKLAEQLGGDSVVLLDPDRTDYESSAYKRHVEQLTLEGVDPGLHAYRFLRAQAYEAIKKHKIIIWNQAFTNADIFQKMIGRLQDHAKEHDTTLAILIVEVSISPEIARARITQRQQQGGHGMSAGTFARFEATYASFAKLGYETITVSGQASANDSVAAILARINSLLS
jgi:thymidylate kinase